LVKEVLARNPSLAQMEAAWQAASARYPQVTSLDDPMIGAALAPGSIGSNEVEFGYRLEISQKYLFPGKRALRGQSALAEASAAGHDVEDMRLQLIESAKSAFYDYYLVQHALFVNREGLGLLQEFRQNAETRYKTGLAPQQDVLQGEVELGKQRGRQLSLERTQRIAIARINTLLHTPPDSPLPPAPEQIQMAEPLPDAQALRARALAQRPDLLALADRLRAEEAALALARKEYYPDVEATAAYDTIMGNGPTRDLAGQIGIRVNLPVRRERRSAAVAEAEARLAMRRAELAKLTDQMNLQVQEAYEHLIEAEKVVQLYRSTILPAAQSNVRAAQSAYMTGKTPFLSLIEAERSLLELRDRYYESVAGYFRRRAGLERMTGGVLPPAT